MQSNFEDEEQPAIEYTGEKIKYHVYYWTGRYPNEKEHITEFEAYDDNDAINIVDKSHLSLVKYAMFNHKGKQIKVGN